MHERTYRIALSTGAAVSIFLAPAVFGTDSQDRPAKPLERAGDAPGTPVPQETTPGLRLEHNGFTSVQVNVDDEGNNIVGDAANEPSIAVDPNNSTRAAVGWRQFDTITSNFRQAGNAFTGDGGRTWTSPGVIDPGVFRSDPVLDFDADGNFYYNSLTLDGNDFLCDVFISENGGQTWGPGVFAFGGDKQWMAIDRTDGIGRGNIYANWTVFFSSCNGQFTRSYDQGDSYLPCIDVPGEPQWGTVTVGPDGAVYVVGRGLVVAKSSTLQDPENSPAFDFSTFVDLGGDVVGFTDPNPDGLSGQAWIAADHSTGGTAGNIYVCASVDPGGSDPLDVHFARSEDGGQTWSNPVRVNAVRNGYQWFGTMSVAPNGRIDVVWYDTRNDPGGFDSEVNYSFSTDAGATWAPAVTMTPPFDPQIGWPQQNKIGDYIDMVSDRVGADLAFAATFNGEQDVYHLRINDYDCNNNGVGDTIDISEGGSGDVNGNGIPDECECLTDLDGSGSVDFGDILAVLAAWGPCEGCPEDLDGDGAVTFQDVLAVLGAALGTLSVGVIEQEPQRHRGAEDKTSGGGAGLARDCGSPVGRPRDEPSERPLRSHHGSPTLPSLCASAPLWFRAVVLQHET